MLAMSMVAFGGVPARAADEAFDVDDYLDILRDALTPAAAGLFENVRHELRATARPLPDRVRSRLRPFFDGVRRDGVPLTADVLDRARYTVDAPAARELFALTPTRVAAITVGDVLAFAPGEYRPDCIEGVALIAHELVHVAQYAALGRDRFLDRYFLKETLQRQLGSGSRGTADSDENALEVAAYCHQAAVCRALARARELRACGGREEPVCPACPSRYGR